MDSEGKWVVVGTFPSGYRGPLQREDDEFVHTSFWGAMGVAHGIEALDADDQIKDITVEPASQWEADIMAMMVRNG